MYIPRWVCTVQVDAKVKGKTGLMVATAEGWPEVVRVLLESGAKVDESVYMHHSIPELCIYYVCMYAPVRMVGTFIAG